MIRKRHWVLWLLAVPFLLLASAVAMAVQPDEVLSDPALEARARALSAELRCVVCQNQSIDDSNAPLARDLRLLLRERISAGDSDEEVKQFLVDRYGTFVLLRPPFDSRTIILWLTPLVILVGAGVIIMWKSSRLRKEPAETGRRLSCQEEEKLRALLSDGDDQSPIAAAPADERVAAKSLRGS